MKLSNALRQIERTNNKNVPFLKHFLRENKRSYGRIKTVPSTINKLNKRYSKRIGDKAGVTIIEPTRKAVLRRAKKIQKRYRHNKRDIDNYYKNPKDDVYYGYHVGIKDKEKRRMEVQIKTNKMAELQKKMHSAYKMDRSLKPFREKAKKLYKKGY